MKLTREVFYGGILLTFFSLLAGLFAYLTKLLLVNNLPVEEYGLFFSVLTVILFLHVFTSLGLPAGLSRTIAEYRVKGYFDRMKSIMVGSFLLQQTIAFFLVFILFILSDYLAINYFGNPDAKWLLVVLSLLFPLNILKNHMSSLFNGFSKNKYLSLIQFIHNFGIFLIVLIGFQLFTGIIVPVIAYLGTFLLLLLIFTKPFFSTFNMFKFPFSKFISSNKKLLFFSLPLAVTTVGTVFIAYFDTLMLTYYLSLTEVGVYNIIYPTALLLAIIGSSLGLALLPVITKLWEEKKRNLIANAYTVLYTYVFALVIPLSVVLIMLSEHIIRVFFGADYLVGTTAFIILVLGSIFYVLVSIHHQTLVGLGKPSKVMWMYLAGSITNIILNILLIPLYSLTGAAIATVSSFILMFIISFYFLNQDLRLIIPLKKILLIVLASTSIVFSTYLFWKLAFNPYVLTALGLIVGSSIYTIICLGLKIISLKEFVKLTGFDINRIFNSR